MNYNVSHLIVNMKNILNFALHAVGDCVETY